MYWWRVLMNSDSRWLSDSWELFTDPAIHNADHTSLYSVTVCPVRTQVSSARHAEDRKENKLILCWEQTMSLDATDTCIVPKTNRDCAKTTKTPRRVSKREGTTSSTWVDRQTWLHFPTCACHPKTVARLSNNSLGQSVVGLNIVVQESSSQQFLRNHDRHEVSLHLGRYRMDSEVWRNKRVIHLFWTYWNTTWESLNSSQNTKRPIAVLAILHSPSVTSFMSQDKPIFIIEFFCFSCNRFTNFNLIVSQRLEPSVCLSSWS